MGSSNQPDVEYLAVDTDFALNGVVIEGLAIVECSIECGEFGSVNCHFELLADDECRLGITDCDIAESRNRGLIKNLPGESAASPVTEWE